MLIAFDFVLTSKISEFIRNEEFKTFRQNELRYSKFLLKNRSDQKKYFVTFNTVFTIVTS